MSTGLCPQNPTYLTDYSEKDKPWDIHKGQADLMAAMFRRAGMERHAVRVSECSGRLGFAWVTDGTTGEMRLKLREARFCRVRHCPICQWRRSKLWLYRFFEAVPRIIPKYPTARWLFLTLTVRNCPVSELRSTLAHMNKSWERMTHRKAWPALGWIRTTEVTHGEGDTAHPHFHVLMMVPPGYFKGGQYLSHERWTELWQKALRADYRPVVNIKVVKPTKDRQAIDLQASVDAVWAAAPEVLKYATKPSDMIGKGPEDPASVAWFEQLVNQVKNMRFIASGGVLKDVLADEASDEDLIHAGEEEPGGGEGPLPTLSFAWNRPVQRYKRGM